MSVQSIIKRDIELVRQENEKNIIDSADKYMYKKRFALGCDYDKEKFKFDYTLQGILHTENCELFEYIESVVEGNIMKLNNKTISAVAQYNISFEELFLRWQAQGNKGNFDFFLDTIINNGVTLEKNGW